MNYKLAVNALIITAVLAILLWMWTVKSWADVVNKNIIELNKK